MTNETIQTIRSRRSCRAYKPEQITNEELEAVLGAGTYAASAMGKQSAKIVVVQDAATREKLSRMNAAIMGKDCDPMYGAPTILVVLADANAKCAVQDGGQHQVAHDKAAVGYGICGVSIGQHHQDGGSAVHGVGVLAHDSGVHAGELGAGGSVLHDHDLCALAAHGTGGVGAGFQHGIQFFVCDLLRLIGTAAAAVFDGFQGFVGHSNSLP